MSEELNQEEFEGENATEIALAIEAKTNKDAVEDNVLEIDKPATETKPIDLSALTTEPSQEEEKKPEVKEGENKEEEEKKEDEEPILPLPQFKKEVRESWDKMTPEGQKALIDQYKATQSTFIPLFQELAPLRKVLQEDWAPYVEQVAPGRNPIEHINSLLQLEAALLSPQVSNDEKIAIMQNIAEMGSVVPPEKVPERDQEKERLYNSPEYKALAAREQQRQYEEAQRQEMQRQQAINSYARQYQGYSHGFDAWSKEKGEDGSPKYPYFAYVRGEMGQLARVQMSKGLTKEQLNLEELYETACQINPLVKTKLQSNKQQLSRSSHAGGSISGNGNNKSKGLLEELDGLDNALDIAMALERATS